MRDEELSRRSLFKGLFTRISENVIIALRQESGQGEGTWYPRPPGAVAEPEFSRLCDGCGECVKACPHQCILLKSEGKKKDQLKAFIDPQENPCKLCPELFCTHSCPTGAIKPLKEIAEVRIGMAQLDQDRCIAWGSMYCERCVLQCPLSGSAITNDKIDGPVITELCTGCGICVKSCEAVNTIQAIQIIPVAASTQTN